MKVCMLDPLFYPYFGGTEKVVMEVGSRLVRDHGYEVQVLTSMIPQAKGRDVEVVEGMEVVRTPSIYFERLPAFLPPPFTLTPTLNRELRKRCGDADIYHVHNRFWYPFSTYREAKKAGGSSSSPFTTPGLRASRNRWTDGEVCSTTSSDTRCSASATTSIA